jgi:hypothetical protein
MITHVNRNSNVFISSSGEQSHLVAKYLRDWLFQLIQSAQPWMSESEVEKGSLSASRERYKPHAGRCQAVKPPSRSPSDVPTTSTAEGPFGEVRFTVKGINLNTGTEETHDIALTLEVETLGKLRKEQTADDVERGYVRFMPDDMQQLHGIPKPSQEQRENLTPKGWPASRHNASRRREVPPLLIREFLPITPVKSLALIGKAAADQR